MFRKIFTNNLFNSGFFFLTGLMIAISLGSYNQSDPSFNLATANIPQNWLGSFGAHIADLLYQFTGLAAVLVPIVFIAWSYLIYINGRLDWKLLKFPSLLISLSFASIALGSLTINQLPANGGGVIGIYFSNLLITEFSIVQNIITQISTAIALIFLMITIGIRPAMYVDWAMSIVNFVAKILSPIALFFSFIDSKSSNSNQQKYHPEQPMSTNNLGALDSLKSFFLVDKNPENIPAHAIFLQDDKSETKPLFKANSYNKVNTPADNPDIEEITAILPSTDLLDQANEQNIHKQTPDELDSKASELLSVLSDFGVKGKIIDIKQGPVVTMYEFEPAAGTKSSRVIGLSDDIARSLSAISTRIAVIPGRNALGIELPNKTRMFFRLRKLVETEQFNDKNIILPIILGKDLGGRVLVTDLAKMPHLLVAGTTGSGKSVAINAMIMSLLYRYTPAECKMIMIDPKMLELSAYDNIPHLLTPVVTEPGKAVVALKWAVKEMENRYRLMSHLGVRNIANFNTKILEAKKEGKILERKMQTGFDPETGKPIFESVPIEMNKMPFIVVIVDEMADLMLVAGKDIEGSIQRLAQMARAAGIHIIMATQRPSVDVITGVIKANFPSRISFKVTSKIDSRTILGEQGSEQLLGMGDMLFMGNSARILRVHGPFVDDKEVERVTNFLRSTGVPEYVSAVTESDEENISDNQDVSDSNDIYTQAVNIVKIERKCSISYIQRCLRIGYNRAANLVDEMEKNGVLSAPNHSGKREILLPED